jgi:hypothetical protein
MPSVDEDQQGNLGLTWMESSSTEYLSMWVGTKEKGEKEEEEGEGKTDGANKGGEKEEEEGEEKRDGNFSAQPAAPGLGFFYVSFRIGDYSTIVLDPSDGKTFWAANEYIGSDGATDIWRTHITSFAAR